MLLDVPLPPHGHIRTISLMVSPFHPFGVYPPFEMFMGHQRRIHLPSSSSSLQSLSSIVIAKGNDVVVRKGNRYDFYSRLSLLKYGGHIEAVNSGGSIR